MDKIERENVVFTPQGKGRAIFALPDGTYVVQLESGGRAVFQSEELLCFLRNLASSEDHFEAPVPVRKVRAGRIGRLQGYQRRCRPRRFDLTDL